MDILTLLELVVLVSAVLYFFQTTPGKRVGNFLPTPFWIYFLSIVLSSAKILPQKSAVYGWVGVHALPAALILMLIGTPITVLIQLGPKALVAMMIGMASMFLGTLLSFIIFLRWMPPEGWKMAGAMLGTWTGGSANLVSVKEVVGLSDAGLAPLIVADTILSYGWLALLMMGVSYQVWFDRKITKKEKKGEVGLTQPQTTKPKKNFKVTNLLSVLVIGILLGEGMVALGGFVAGPFSFLSAKAWTILLATTSAVLLAMTPLQKLEHWGASKVGTFLLYLVLAGIGASTQLSAALDAGVVLGFGLLVLVLHGAALFFLGRSLRIPMFLIATASQANVGGPVSAPLVAGVYRPGAAHVGVLMAILGAIFGTYVGAFGGWVCRSLQMFFS